MKKINLLWTDSRDVQYPIDEPNPVHVESSGQGKARLTSSSHPDGLTPKLCHLGRHMG